jgi:hypothetical protein
VGELKLLMLFSTRPDALSEPPFTDAIFFRDYRHERFYRKSPMFSQWYVQPLRECENT